MRIKSLRRDEIGNYLEFIIITHGKSYFILGIYLFIFGYSRIALNLDFANEFIINCSEFLKTYVSFISND